MPVNLKKIDELYTGNIQKYGIDSKSVGWSNLESQYLRFEKLSLVIENKNTPFTINELGCGYGELFVYLKKNRFKLKLFRGYDISDTMLDMAKKYLKSEKVTLIKNHSINSMADYSITSGIFNVKFNEKKKLWEEYIKNTLSNMWKFSSKGISFNMLTKYVDYEERHLYYADPSYYFNFCKKNFSKYVNLIHDYKLYEWTIVVKK